MFHINPYDRIFFRDLRYLDPYSIFRMPGVYSPYPILPIYSKPEIKLTNKDITPEMIKEIKSNNDIIIKIMKIIIQNVFDNKTEQNDKILEKIKSNLSTYNLPQIVKNSDGTKYLFNDDNLKAIISKLKDSDIIKKICLFGTCSGAFNLTVSQSGGDYKLANPEQFTKFRSEVQICFNGKCVVSRKSECDNCDRWIKERIELRNKLMEFFNRRDGNIFEFIYENIDYLPVLMLDQQNYHKFFELYGEYQRQKQFR